jgi:hypothetical protein
MSAVVADADPVNPQYTNGWLDYAQHCGFVTDAARVRSLKDRPRVERTVRYVRSCCMAAETFVDLAHAQVHARTRCLQLPGQRIHGTTQHRPAEHFRSEEARRSVVPVLRLHRTRDRAPEELAHPGRETTPADPLVGGIAESRGLCGFRAAGWTTCISLKWRAATGLQARVISWRGRPQPWRQPAGAPPDRTLAHAPEGAPGRPPAGCLARAVPD